MIDSLTEQILSLSDAAQSLPFRRGGKRPHVSCIYRWTVSGCKGIKLESLQVGGTRCTSREALSRFFDRLTSAQAGKPIPARTLASRSRAICRPEAELSEAGI